MKSGQSSILPVIIPFFCAAFMTIALDSTVNANQSAQIRKVAGKTFSDYAVPAYSGSRRRPDFTGPGREYLYIRTRVSEGFKQGPLFAGPHVLFGIGCGTNCVFFYIGDLITGQVSKFPLGGEANYNMQLQRRPNSRLVKASWAPNGETGRCSSEDYVWSGGTWHGFGEKTAAGRCPELS